MRQVIIHSNQVSQIIRGRRQALKMTQTKLAPKIALTQNRLSQMEANPNGFSLDKLIELLNLLSLDLVIEDRASKKETEW